MSYSDVSSYQESESSDDIEPISIHWTIPHLPSAFINTVTRYPDPHTLQRQAAQLKGRYAHDKADQVIQWHSVPKEPDVLKQFIPSIQEKKEEVEGTDSAEIGDEFKYQGLSWGLFLKALTTNHGSAGHEGNPLAQLTTGKHFEKIKTLPVTATGKMPDGEFQAILVKG